jgi:ABC-type multidrug transport system fused ATPase/permease subunit
VIGLFLVPLVQAFVETIYTFQLEKIGVQFRNSLMAAIYRKCLRLDNAALGKASTGKIVTHMSNDAQKMQARARHCRLRTPTVLCHSLLMKPGPHW